MPTTESLLSTKILIDAEEELGAYLHAATDLVGLNGLPLAGELWIRTLEEAGCPGPDLAKFFRLITIRSIAQLVHDFPAWAAALSAPSGLTATFAA